MNGLATQELDEAVRRNPENANAYLSRGIYFMLIGDHDKALEDFDSAVRVCSNYNEDCLGPSLELAWVEEYEDKKHEAIMTVDRGFIGYKIELAIKLLDSVIDDSRNCAVDSYYAGVQALFHNNKTSARRFFKKALQLGYEDRAKVKQHLENLKKQR